MVVNGFEIPESAIADFCRRNHIVSMALFGSILRDDFRPESDIDILVEFECGYPVGLFRLTALEMEISDLLRRKVDLNTAGFLSPYFRDEVIRQAVKLYAAA